MRGLVLILIIFISIRALISRQQDITYFSRKMICCLTKFPGGPEKLTWGLWQNWSEEMPLSPCPARLPTSCLYVFALSASVTWEDGCHSVTTALVDGCKPRFSPENFQSLLCITSTQFKAWCGFIRLVTTISFLETVVQILATSSSVESLLELQIMWLQCLSESESRGVF